MPLEAVKVSRSSSNILLTQSLQAQPSQRYGQARLNLRLKHSALPSSAGVQTTRFSSGKCLLRRIDGARHRPLIVQAQAVASSPAKTAVSTTIVLKQCELSFGDSVKAVGESDVFGSWDSEKAPELQWQEGHDWLAKLDVLPGDCTFKLVIVNGSGTTQWESGDNRSVKVPADASGGEVTIMCRYNQTGSTEVQVKPAAAAQQSTAQPQSPVDDLTDDFAAGDAAVQVPAVQERAKDVLEQAEDISDSLSPAQEQAAAQVQETVNEAAPEEDLGDTLSVLQGAESAMDGPESSQASSSKANGAGEASTSAEAGAAEAQAEAGEAEQGASSASSESQGNQENGAEDYSSYKTFGKSKVTDIARDGSITFTFEEDDDVDAQSLSSQLLGSS
ncbi:hypothetical protein WJX77_009036 [Trebouxia sp. C0004]